VSELYSGRQFVGMDLHRRRSVLVRMTESGEHLETVRIVNTADRLADVMSRAGECPEVVLEATYGWYWAADARCGRTPALCIILCRPGRWARPWHVSVCSCDRLATAPWQSTSVGLHSHDRAAERG